MSSAAWPPGGGGSNAVGEAKEPFIRGEDVRESFELLRGIALAWLLPTAWWPPLLRAYVRSLVRRYGPATRTGSVAW